jgi:hypothetical protein
MYNELLTDAKVKYLMAATAQPKPLVIGVWTSILILANQSPVRGSLMITKTMPLPMTQIAGEIGLGETELAHIFGVLLELDMVSLEDGVYSVTNWDTRQFTSDNSTARVRKHRAKKKGGNEKPEQEPGHKPNEYTKRYTGVASNHDETLHVTPPESESESDSTTTTSPILDQIGQLCKDNFTDPCSDELFKANLKKQIQLYTAQGVLDAINLALSPDRANGRNKTWGYVKAILKGQAQDKQNGGKPNGSYQTTNQNNGRRPSKPSLTERPANRTGGNADDLARFVAAHARTSGGRA